MNNKITISASCACLLSFFAAAGLAQETELDEFDESSAAETEEGRYRVSLDVEAGGQVVEQNNKSSKFNEYKDDESDPYLYRLFLNVDDTDTGRYFDFRGRRLSRDDQELNVQAGSFFGEFGSFRGLSIDFDWNETPHLLSNSATTPYDYLGGGRFRVAGGIVDDVQISNVGNASSWTAADAGPGLPGEDSRIARALADSVHPIDLGTQRETGTVGFSMYFSEKTSGRFEFKRDDKDGSILTGASIGDRPPRTMVVQLAEPIDYQTDDFKISLEHHNDRFQVDASYLYSAFENDVGQMTWNSLFHAPNFFCAAIPGCAGAADYDQIRQGSGTRYATVGTVTLSPDNTYHNVTVNGGIRLPWNSRLSASFAYGKMDQDERLIPYATSSFGGTLDALPRGSADAEIDTTMANIVYTVNPLRKLNLKFHYRYHDMDNDTKQDEWFYYTQDSNSHTYLQERINIAYDLEQENIGVELSYYLGKAGTIGFAYENEQKTRPHREVKETDEDIYEISYRVTPIQWATLAGKYTRGDRGGSTYNGEITDQSYHFANVTVADLSRANNPVLSFGNAPGLRKFDVTDRDRDEVDVSLGLLPVDTVTVNLHYQYRNNDYGGSIPTTITTWDSVALAFVTASIDPTQLGLLGDDSNIYAVDISYAPTDALSLYGFYSREEIESRQRGRFLEEDDRNAGIGARDWQNTTGDFLWRTTTGDDTDTVGFGANYAAIEDKLDIDADFSHSSGEVDINYRAGASIVEDDTTSIEDHVEWSSPPDVEFETNTFRIGLKYLLTKQITLGCRYIYETYDVRDWQQEATGAHQDALSDNFVADHDPETAGTPNDRVGSRLVRLDDVPAPDYNVHWGFVTLEYKW